MLWVPVTSDCTMGGAMAIDHFFVIFCIFPLKFSFNERTVNVSCGLLRSFRSGTMCSSGEAEAGSAEEQPVRNNRNREASCFASMLLSGIEVFFSQEQVVFRLMPKKTFLTLYTRASLFFFLV